MGIAGRFPLMKPGHSRRNALVAIGTFFLLPVVVVAIPFYLLVAVGTNRNGLADRLTDSPLGRLPGLRRGSWTAGIAIFGYAVLFLLLFGAVFGGGESPEATASSPEVNESADASAEANVANDLQSTETDQDSGDDQTETSEAATRTEASEGREIERVASDTYPEPGLATGVSRSGDVVLFGFSDGNLVVYDEDRDGEPIALGIDRSVSHIQIGEDGSTATVGWMDAHAYGVLDLDENDGPAIQHPGLWDLDTAGDGSTVVSVSSPAEGTGSVGLSSGGELQWETQFDEAGATSVAITEDGDGIAVGAVHYWGTDSDRQGTPGVKFYDADGTEQWTHETAEDVISVHVDAERELVVAGTDDGKTIVLDFDGDVQWETDEYGGWVALSEDGSTIVTSTTDGVLAVDAETGDERWSTDVGAQAFEDISVSDDGSRVLAANRAAGEVFVVDEGDVVWEETYDVGPARGDISGDGTTWSVIVQNNDDQTAEFEIYRDA